MFVNQIPNVLTVLRIILIVPFSYFLIEQSYQKAFLVFVIAGISDGVDGFLARHFNWRSRFGAIADPLADKLLLVTTYILLTWLGELPLWLVLLIFGRDLIIVFGGLLFHYKVHRFDVQPTLLGKICTFIQITYVVVLLLHLAGHAALGPLIDFGVYLVAGITLLSGLNYIHIWGRRTRDAFSKGES